MTPPTEYQFASALHKAVKLAKNRQPGALRFHASYATIATEGVSATRRADLTYRELKKLARLP
jgi:hypothetical protein